LRAVEDKKAIITELTFQGGLHAFELTPFVLISSPTRYQFTARRLIPAKKRALSITALEVLRTKAETNRR
jgi:hypothetical protein